MKVLKFFAVPLLVLAACAMPVGAARADTLLYDGISVILGRSLRCSRSTSRGRVA